MISGKISSSASAAALLCLCSLATIVGVESQAAYVYKICPNETTFDANSTYHSNLNALLSSFSSATAEISSGFGNTTSGKSPDRVYGLFLCRGDLSSDACGDCVTFAVRDAPQRCPERRRAVIWYDQCMLRYSDVNFFGAVGAYGILLYNTQNSTRNSEFGALSLIYGLVDKAPRTKRMFIADESEGSNSFRKRYGLVQCTRDLDSEGCYSCLKNLTDQTKQCCIERVGWRILATSCSLRYELYPFFNHTPSLAPSDPAQSPTEAAHTDNGEEANQKGKIIAISVSSSFVILAALSGLFYWWCYCPKDAKDEEIPLPISRGANGGPLFEGGIVVEDLGDDREMHYLSLATIEASTNGFSDANKLGEGGFGPVYKGKLLNGKEVAVKRLSMKSTQGLEEFKNEVLLIIKLQHKNLVRLLGYCFEKDEKILVYEYMANKSLDAILFDPCRRKELDWEMRSSIITGTARGLQYLHEDSRLKIIHRDLKASNVLLDDEMKPKISDFGTARIFGAKQMEASTERIVGTFGYMAPEYALEGFFSIKSDVYSFGILVLEVISGRKNREFYFEEHSQNLLSHAWKLWAEGRGEELIDQVIYGNCPLTDVLKRIHIALLCVQHDPADRPTMSQVILMLGSKSMDLPQLSTPPYSAAKFVTFSDQSLTFGGLTSSLESCGSSTKFST